MADDQWGDRYSPYITSKRARQACENCRRKKSKCSGEKPECSFCVRLRQKCVYARHYRIRSSREDGDGDMVDAPTSHDASSDLRLAVPELMIWQSNRLTAIEGRLEQLAAAIDLHRPSSRDRPTSRPASDQQSISQTPRNAAAVPSPIPPITEPTPVWSGITGGSQLPEAVITDGIELYFTNYCNQPCPILAHSASLSSSADTRFPPIILYPMLSLSLRSCQHPFLDGQNERQDCINRLTQLSWNLLAEAYAEFNLDDAYLQGLCLLAQVDGGDGKPDRAQVQIALGLRLAQSRGMLSAKSREALEPLDRIRRQEIVWSLFILDRMISGGAIRGPSLARGAFELPTFQFGPHHPDQSTRPQSSDVTDRLLESEASLMIHSVGWVNIQLLEIWEHVLADITLPASDTDIPLWRHDSPRAAILTSILELETSQEPVTITRPLDHPPEYYKNQKLGITSLLGCTFSLFFPFFIVACVYKVRKIEVYSLSRTSRNHPFIIYVKTISFKDRVPVTFLQKSYEYSAVHANWVFRLLNDMDDAGLALHDPFIGHLVAIAASIHLEHTLSRYPTVANSARQKFEKCFGFVKKLSEEWPKMLITVSLLEKLKSMIRHRSNRNYVEEEYDGALPSTGDCQVTLEEDEMQLMWRLFDYGSFSAPLYKANGLGDDWTPENTEQGGLLAVDGSLNDVGVQTQAQAYEDPTTRSFGHAADWNALNLVAGMPSNIGTPDVSYGDWSLFGKSWPDYFPDV